jgi:hypothetical protein
MADVSNFHVDVLPDEGQTTVNNRDGAYYVEMPKDNVQYKIRLRNNGSTRCDAAITIDGKYMGTFRINGYGSMLLERPADVERRFTFFVGGSEGSKQGGYKAKDKSNGLIEVLFRPEKKPEPLYNYFESTSLCYDDGEEECCDMGFDDEEYDDMPVPITKGYMNECAQTRGNTIPSGKHGAAKRMTNAPTRGYKEGMTALTGDSDQKFISVSVLDYDFSREATIHLRLVYRDVRPKIEPLRPVGSRSSTRYPNPV